MAIRDVSDHSIAELISLKGRSAVITGAAQGLGFAIAKRLAEAGADIILADINGNLAKEAASRLGALYPSRVLPCQVDVTNSQSIQELAELALEAFGGLDIWVSNAGVYPNKSIFETTDDVWDQVMAINLRGVFAGAREASKHMIQSQKGGVIINIVSTAGFSGVAPGVSAYVASKTAVRGLIKQLARELSQHDIRVLGVAPTHCHTEGNIAALAALPARVQEEISATLSSRLGRVGVPDDIARAVLFAASDMAAFMTGSTILVDAGEVC